jgi:RTX toxin transport system membrane fusion protein
MILNRDIGFVAPGQEVAIKLETFQFTRYGTIPGRIASVSRDAMQDPAQQKPTLVYPARITLDRATVDVGGRQTTLGAGMAVTAEIKTDRRRVLDYLLSPILRYQQETMRER